MRHGVIKSAFSIASVLLIALVVVIWVAPFNWAAHMLSIEEKLFEEGSSSNVIRFRNTEDQGLLVKVWVNGSGTYNFAVDTGAGAIILSKRVASQAKVQVSGQTINLSGMSGVNFSKAQRASLRSLAIGNKNNLLPVDGFVIVTNSLPEGIDGIVDPTEVYKRIGFTINMPDNFISTFDPSKTPIRITDVPANGAVVHWLSERDANRPLIKLNNHNALIDTGSRLGLGLNPSVAKSFGIKAISDEDDHQSFDLGGGKFYTRRVSPLTVSIGPMVLRNIPTHLLLNASSDAPIILGREALHPFILSFDPVNRLIRIRPK
jgi:predicted aspartyl protease